ncbi:MAG: dihydroorotate dehydrogenase electron transfer subunit [Clostridiales bacterium]|nr:dihydroorotate dehydrogenase electron transfer subunit [Clostridiales bacterium]
MKTIKAELTISSIEKHGKNLYRVTCASKTALPKISAGQFAHLKVPNKELRRPVCVYRNTENTVTFIVADVGEGTNSFVTQNKGAQFDALLPLGNGFPVLPDKTNIAVIGGGTGCAPLLKIAEDNPSLNCTALLGFQNKAAKGVYGDDFDKFFKKVCYCTDDGSLGYHGFPTDLLTEIAPEVLYVCGAAGMVKTVREYCRKLGVIGFVSMEQRMGCGVGACLVCSVKVMREGNEKLLRACADGPVFPIEDVVL